MFWVPPRPPPAGINLDRLRGRDVFADHAEKKRRLREAWQPGGELADRAEEQRKQDLAEAAHRAEERRKREVERIARKRLDEAERAERQRQLAKVEHTGNGSRVYFVRIGAAIKIGVTTDLKERLNNFSSVTAETIEVLAIFPGDRGTEARLHRLFGDLRIKRELFPDEPPIREFLDLSKANGFSTALVWADARISSKPLNDFPVEADAPPAAATPALEEITS
jgi:hypothetical protein